MTERRIKWVPSHYVHLQRVHDGFKIFIDPEDISTSPYRRLMVTSMDNVSRCRVCGKRLGPGALILQFHVYYYQTNWATGHKFWTMVGNAHIDCVPVHLRTEKPDERIEWCNSQLSLVL